MSAKNYTREKLLSIGSAFVQSIGFDRNDADRPFKSLKADDETTVYKKLKKALTDWIEEGQPTKDGDSAVYLADLPDAVKSFLAKEKVCTQDDIDNDSAENDEDTDGELEDDDAIDDEDDDAEDGDDADEDDAEDDEDADDIEDADDGDDSDEDEDDDDIDADEDASDDDLDLDALLAGDDDDVQPEPEPRKGGAARRGRTAKPSHAVISDEDDGVDIKVRDLVIEQPRNSATSVPVTSANAEATVAALCRMLAEGKVVVITALDIKEASQYFSAGTQATAGDSADEDSADADTDDETLEPAPAAAKKTGTRNRPKPEARAAAAAKTSADSTSGLTAAQSKELKAVQRKATSEIAELLSTTMMRRPRRMEYIESKRVKLPSGVDSWEEVGTRSLATIITDHAVAAATRKYMKSIG